MNPPSNQYIEAISDEQLLSLIKGVVNRYVQKRAIPKRELEDVVMSVVEKFFNQREKIESAFEGKSKLTTYYIAVINRMCCEVIRKEGKQWNQVVNEEPIFERESSSKNPFEIEKQLVFKQEAKRLKFLFQLFNEDKAKTILFLKFYFDLPFDIDDIKEYTGDKHHEVYRFLTATLGEKSKGEIFTTLASVVNMVEQKNIGGDAVRIWFTNQVNALIKRLNGNGITQHDKESLAILLEMLYTEKSASMYNTGSILLILILIGSLC